MHAPSFGRIIAPNWLFGLPNISIKLRQLMAGDFLPGHFQNHMTVTIIWVSKSAWILIGKRKLCDC